MTWSERNASKSWTPKQEADLRRLARSNTPTPVIGFKLGRSPTAVSSKASELGVSLRPTNRSPYNRRKS